MRHALHQCGPVLCSFSFALFLLLGALIILGLFFSLDRNGWHVQSVLSSVRVGEAEVGGVRGQRKKVFFFLRVGGCGRESRVAGLDDRRFTEQTKQTHTHKLWGGGSSDGGYVRNGCRVWQLDRWADDAD